MATLLISLFLFLFGVCVGSFLNVCIYRLPRAGLTVARPRRSFCPSCGSAIRASDNLPVLGWLRLAGHCRDCKSPISCRYPLVELFTGLIFLFLGARFLLGDAPPAPVPFVVLAVLVAALMVASLIDLELRIIPDAITIRGMMLAPFALLAAPEIHAALRGGWLSRRLVGLEPHLAQLGQALPEVLRGGLGLGGALVAAFVTGAAIGFFGFTFYGRLVPTDPPRKLTDGLLGGVLGGVVAALLAALLLHPEWVHEPRVESLVHGLVGMLTGSSLVFLVGIAGTLLFRKDAMGFGDVKLMGLLGAFAGALGVVGGFFLACFLGSIVGVYLLLRWKSRYIPFGPFLSVGALAWILWPDPFKGLIEWYLSLFR